MCQLHLQAKENTIIKINTETPKIPNIFTLPCIEISGNSNYFIGQGVKYCGMQLSQNLYFLYHFED